MPDGLPHLSTDQVAAFVELSRQGQIRGAAAVLGITEQGLRSRLVALEAQLGVELYRKSRGPRRATRLRVLRAVRRGHPGVRAGDGVRPDLVRGRGGRDALGVA